MHWLLLWVKAFNILCDLVQNFVEHISKSSPMAGKLRWLIILYVIPIMEWGLFREPKTPPPFWSMPAVWVICCERAEAPRQSGKHSIWHGNGKIVLCVWPNTRAVLTSGDQEKGTGAPHASLVYSSVLCFCTNLISIEFYWLKTPYQKPTTIFKTSAFYDLFPILNSYFILIICIFMLVMYPTRERYIPLTKKVRQ